MRNKPTKLGRVRKSTMSRYWYVSYCAVEALTGRKGWWWSRTQGGFSSCEAAMNWAYINLPRIEGIDA